MAGEHSDQPGECGFDAGTGRRTDGGTADSVEIVLESDMDDEWTVDERIFGKFTEMNAKEGYPGIYATHLANGSFEEWYTWPKNTPEDDPRWWRRTEVIYRDTETYPGIAYPWEPAELSEEAGAEGVTFVHVEGGDHGLNDDDTGRVDVLGAPVVDSGPRFQRVTVDDATAGVRQRVAIPDQRTLAFDVEVSVRSSDLDQCEVRLETQEGDVLASEVVPLTDEWVHHELTLELPGPAGTRYRDSPFGEYALAFVASGTGSLDLDRAMLRSGDAVNGKFNPTTIEQVRAYGIPSIRWPGGNFASHYIWHDGIGPLEDRPVRTELHWGGLEPNYLGVAEFLEFCELADVDPYLNVGFSEHFTPDHTAELLEYVRGSTDTEYGQLRAEHGHPDPWDVDVWQIGNETYGDYQIGHTDAHDFAERVVEHAEAIRSVDPDATIIAMGVDPQYTEWEGDGWSGHEWNEILFETAGDVIDGADIHRYTLGDPTDWEGDPIRYNEQLVNFPTQFETLVERVADTAREHGLADPIVTVGEWNLQPRVEDDWPRADYGTMAHAAFVASTYNSFVRQGKVVKFGYQRDNSFKFRPYPADLRPVGTANNRTLQLYREPFAERDADWHHRAVAVDSPTLDLENLWHRFAAMEDVPYVDATAIESADGERVVVFATNRNLTESYAATIDVGTAVDPGASVSVTRQWPTDDPLADGTRWDGTSTSFTVETETRDVSEDGVISVEFPPASVVRLTIER